MKYDDAATIQEVFKQAGSCEHEFVGRELVTDDTKTLVGGWNNDDGSAGYAVAELPDGRWIAASQWEDYSGHGCQCDGTSQVYDSLALALRLGLDQDQRKDALTRLRKNPDGAMAIAELVGE
jgi:hypothetical protein